MWAADDLFVGQWKLNPSRSEIADVRVNTQAVEISYKSKDKITETRQITVSRDLKTLTMTVTSAAKDEPDIDVFERQ